MLVTVEEKVVVSRRTQLTFDFVSPEEAEAATPRRRKAVKAKKSAAQPAPETVSDTAERQNRVADACLMLFELARKFVPANEFRDYTTFTRCAKILCDAGAIKKLPIRPTATTAEHESALITHAPQYRLLRNRAIAGLATIADLGGKAPAKGSPDYQKGMRAAYQHASDVAAMFLEDIQNGV